MTLTFASYEHKAVGFTPVLTWSYDRKQGHCDAYIRVDGIITKWPWSLFKSFILDSELESELLRFEDYVRKTFNQPYYQH